MTPPEMIPLLKIDTEPPPWDGDVKEVRTTVVVNRQLELFRPRPEKVINCGSDLGECFAVDISDTSE